jgi:hypothetical protein
MSRALKLTAPAAPWKVAASSTGVIVVVAFLVRMAIYCYLSYEAYRSGMSLAEGTPYGAEVGAIAANLVAGRGFSSPLQFLPTGPTATLVPVYPLLLAGIFKLFGTYSTLSSLVIRTVDCAFSAATAWPLAAIGTIVFGKKAGRAAAWLWAVLPTSIFYSIFWIWDTALAGLWMALLVLATLKLRGSGRLTAWIGYGALWAVGAMINPSLLGVLPFLAVWALWPQISAPARAAKLAAMSALVFAIGLAPWTVRNYAAFHKFIPLRSNFGLELWSGIRVDQADGLRSLVQPNDNPAEARRYAQMGEIAYMEDDRRQAWALIRDNPANAALLVLRHIEETWLDLRDPPVDAWMAGSLSDRLAMLGNALFFGFCFAGVLGALRLQKEEAVPLLLVLLTYPLVFYITHASLRYRQPIDGIMLVVAVYAVGDLFMRISARSEVDSRKVPTVSRAGADSQ